MSACSTCANNVTFPEFSCKRKLGGVKCKWEERFKAKPKEVKSGKKKAQNKKRTNASR